MTGEQYIVGSMHLSLSFDFVKDVSLSQVVYLYSRAANHIYIYYVYSHSFTITAETHLNILPYIMYNMGELII